jgi:hypothetical protein
MSTIVEFVGLCVFTSQAVIGNPTTSSAIRNVLRARPAAVTTRVVAIMPRVPDGIDPRSAQAIQMSPARGRATPLPMSPERYDLPPVAEAAAHSSHGMTLDAAAGVEKHTAMLAFKHSDLLSLSGWGPIKTLSTGYDYVELGSGDQVTFVPDQSNSPVNDPTPLPLAHLGNTPLLARYQHPYAGAAAVFTIPAGTLSACEKNGGRVDTTLTLNTRHQLTIKAGAKSLTVKDNALIIAANVPLQLAQTGTESSTAASNHYMVYCAMQGRMGAACTKPQQTSSPSHCGAAFRPSGDPEKNGGEAGAMSIDYACSNSQWP